MARRLIPTILAVATPTDGSGLAAGSMDYCGEFDPENSVTVVYFTLQ